MTVITLPWSMEQDRANQIKANSLHVDDNFNTLLNGVNGKLDLDGTSSPTANISMASHKLTNLATPTASGDAATKGYVDSADTALSATCVKLSGNQTIAGTKTFSSSPVVPAPTNNTDASTKKYVDDSITTLSNACVKLSGTQTITGAKTFSNTIVGSINGNAATVTNGVYTTGNQTIAGTKTFSSTISGSINGNAATVTNGVYTTGNQTIDGTKTFSASPIIPTPSSSDNSTKAATTAFVKTAISSKANTDLSNVSNNIDYIIETQLPTADNNYTWYRKYKSGWVEQGGKADPTSVGDHRFSVNFPVTMSDTNYNVQVTIINDSSNSNPTYASVGVRTKSTTYFTIYDVVGSPKDWLICGIAA